MIHAIPDDIWTPARVKDVLADAIKWARRYAGPVGPAPIRGSLPTYKPSLEDHLEEGWGIPEVAGDDDAEDREIELPVDPARADVLMAALSWVSIYLINAGHPATGEVVSLWMAHSTGRNRSGFEGAARRRGMSRAHAYRLRDRGLSIIAQGLTADGVRHE